VRVPAASPLHSNAPRFIEGGGLRQFSKSFALFVLTRMSNTLTRPCFGWKVLPSGDPLGAKETTTVAQETKLFDGLVGFSAGASPAKSLRAKVGENPKDHPNSPPPPPPEVSSDSRLKTDIRQVGTTAHDLPLYTFRYIGDDGHYEGVMAQDVLKVMPEAVSVGVLSFAMRRILRFLSRSGTRFR
jgi:hypothetical protein